MPRFRGYRDARTLTNRLAAIARVVQRLKYSEITVNNAFINRSTDENLSNSYEAVRNKIRRQSQSSRMVVPRSI